MSRGVPLAVLPIGYRVSKLVVVSVEISKRGIATRYGLRCDCGSQTSFRASDIACREPRIRSCGCYRRQRAASAAMARARIPQEAKATYSSWSAMHSRCSRPGTNGFKNYGGRGITVCERWSSFELFLADMGIRPLGYTLGRVDNDGHYAPENCRWEDLRSQSRNKRNSRLVTALGQIRGLAEWGEVTGLPQNVIGSRLRDGWLPDDAVTRPLRVTSRTQRVR